MMRSAAAPDGRVGPLSLEEQVGMRVLPVPPFGDGRDRTALEAAHTIAQPFRSHIAGLLVRRMLNDDGPPVLITH